MKDGDIIICHKVCQILDTGEKTTTIGKSYPIIVFDVDKFLILDDQDDEHEFRIDEYHIWFKSKELLNKKLKKIKCVKFD